MSEREWPSDDAFSPRTKEEWKALPKSDDPEERLLPAKLLKALSYSPRDYVKWPLEKKFECIFKHQADAFGEDSLTGGGGSNGKSKASTKTSSKASTKKTSNGATKAGGSVLDRFKKGGKGAAKPQPVDQVEEQEDSPVEKVAKSATKSSGGGVSSEQFSKLLKILEKQGEALAELTEKVDGLEGVSDRIESMEALVTEAHFGVMILASQDENFFDEEARESVLGTPQILTEEAEEEEGED